MKKCQYFNNHHTACTLMIDDFSLTATTIDGIINASNDWGYALNAPNSLYSYFQKNLLDKFPEIKGSFFYPLAKHAAQNIQAGYKLYFRDPDSQFKDFLHSISSNFGVAFHGTTHGRFIQPNNPSFSNWQHEFSYLSPTDIPGIKEEIKKFETIIEIKLQGGKYPGWAFNNSSESIIEELGFKWWVPTWKGINKKDIHNMFSYSGSKHKYLNIPCNLAGSSFNNILYPHQSKKSNTYRKIKNEFLKYKLELYLQYLYESQSLISIHEHFQNLRTDGNRQPNNIYDDLHSLDYIYTTLKGCDVWYATCDQIAHYKESYNYTEIKTVEQNQYQISYNGRWKYPFLSVITKSSTIKNIRSNEVIKGIYKNGDWVYNNIPEGIYVVL